MKERKFKILVLENGKVVVDGVPVKKGQSVEVIIRIEEPVEPSYPLRGLPVRYDAPFGPAVEDTEWEASR
jgi:hypothetical protein